MPFTSLESISRDMALMGVMVNARPAQSMLMDYPESTAHRTRHSVLAPASAIVPQQFTVMPQPVQQTQQQTDKPIGYGAFGVVWAVTDPRDGKRLALKKMTNVFHNLISCKRVYRELCMLAVFKHENVISLTDIVSPEPSNAFNEIYVLTELMQSDLHKIIVSPQALSADHIKVFLYQILRGLKYLQSAGVLHRDIKPGNLLVNSNCCLKICDFGLARTYEPEEDAHMTQEVVTQYYRAPEILMGCTHYDYSIDIWSVGCIFAELLSRRILFQAQGPVQQLDMIINLVGTPRPEDMEHVCEGARNHIMNQPFKKQNLLSLYNLSPHATHEAVHLLTRMLILNPKNRISAEEALSHPYLDEGRVRFHSCMCTCCKAPNGIGRRQISPDTVWEPTCPTPFSHNFDSHLTSMRRVRDELCYVIDKFQKKSHRVPLQLNPFSANYKPFQDCQAAQPSERAVPATQIWQ